jgi:hypothetical protein
MQISADSQRTTYRKTAQLGERNETTCAPKVMKRKLRPSNGYRSMLGAWPNFGDHARLRGRGRADGYEILSDLRRLSQNLSRCGFALHLELGAAEATDIAWSMPEGCRYALARAARVVGSCKAVPSHQSLDPPDWISPALAGPTKACVAKL